MKTKTFLKSIFSTKGSTAGEAAQNASPGTPSYLTSQEVGDILAELVEKDETGRIVPPVAFHQACSQLTYVALAAMFPAEQRVQASCAGLCYIQLLGDDAQEGCVRVAALPSHLEPANRRKVYSLIVTREQMCQMLPWDRTLQRLETCCVREVLQTYVSQINGGAVSAHPYELGTDGLPVQEPVRIPDVQREPSEGVWTVLPEVFVSATTAQDLADRIKESAVHGGKKICPQRLFWLKTMIAMLDRQLLHLGMKKHPELAHLYMKLLGIAEHISAALKRRSGPRKQLFWVNVNAVRRNDRCLGWHIVIGLPQSVLQAWGF